MEEVSVLTAAAIKQRCWLTYVTSHCCQMQMPSKRGTVASLQQHEWLTGLQQAVQPSQHHQHLAAAAIDPGEGHLLTLIGEPASARDSQGTGTTTHSSDSTEENCVQPGGVPLLSGGGKAKGGSLQLEPSSGAGVAPAVEADAGIMASASKLFAKILGLGQQRESQQQGDEGLIKAGPWD